MSTMQKARVRSSAPEGLTITPDHETRTVYIYVGRRIRGTADEEFAEIIEQMSRSRREWQERGYRVEFIR